MLPRRWICSSSEVKTGGLYLFNKRENNNTGTDDKISEAPAIADRMEGESMIALLSFYPISFYLD